MPDDGIGHSGNRRQSLTRGDVIATEVRRMDDGSFVADASDWNRLKYFDFDEESPNVSEGEQILARVLSAGKYAAYIEVVDISGFIMRATLEPGSTSATPVNTDYRTNVHLDEPALVGGLADVRVTDISEVINGRVHLYDNNPPEVGDRFRTHLDYGSGPHHVQPSDRNYELLLTEDVLATGDVEIEITKVGCPMEGKISSYCGNLPEIGYTFQAQAEHSHGPHRAAPPNGRYPVTIDEDILASGMVEIEIVEHGLPMIGEISSYCGNLPEIGHTFYTQIDRNEGPHQVLSPDEDYAVVVDDDMLISGVVEIEIIGHGLPMQGGINSYCGNLPEIGHSFHAQVEYGPGPHKLSSPEERYTVVVSEDVLVSGEVEVEIVERGLPMIGEISSYCGNLPEIGHTFRTEIPDGSGPHQISAPNEQYEVQIGDNVMAAGEIEIEILERDLPMCGRVSSYCGNLPTIGQSFTVHLSHGPDMQTVRSPDNRYTLSIEEYVLITGKAEIELTKHSLPMKAQVISYHDKVPAVGDTITTRVRAMQQIVESPTETFQIELTERASKTGTVQIEITDVSDAIYGEIREYESIAQDLSAYQSPRKSSMVNNSHITGRKL